MWVCLPVSLSNYVESSLSFQNIQFLVRIELVEVICKKLICDWIPTKCSVFFLPYSLGFYKNKHEMNTKSINISTTTISIFGCCLQTFNASTIEFTWFPLEEIVKTSLQFQPIIEQNATKCIREVLEKFRHELINF